MVLSPDCVRDVLLAVEACGFGERITLDALQDKLPAYAEEDLWYTSIKLWEGGYLDVMTVSAIGMPIPGVKQINDITYVGHEFLNTIRDTDNWGKIKSVSKKAGITSLKALAKIGTDVASAAIASALQSCL